MNTEAVWDEKANRYAITVTEPEKESPKPEAVEGAFASGLLDKLAGMDLMGVPLGEAIIGAAGGVLVDRVVGKYVGQWGTVGNLAVAFAVGKFGPHYIGSRASKAIALVLTYEALADKVSEQLNRVLPPVLPQSSVAVRQAEAVVSQSAAGPALGSYGRAF